MLRDKNLIPLSHQHQHALALCVRIDRASPVHASALEAWQTEIVQHFRTEICVHFAAEEQVLFPAARRFKELVPLVEELLKDHDTLRQYFTRAEAGKLSSEELSTFAQQLSAHVRKEERKLFERLQELMTSEELAELGTQLDAVLKAAATTCSLPSKEPRPRSAR